MKYLSANEVANLWKISPTRVMELARKGKIVGAQRLGNRWMIPSNALKPTDGRTKHAKTNIAPYRFPMTIFGNYSQEDILSFTKEEQLFHKAQILYCNYEMEKTKTILSGLLETTKNQNIKIGTLYLLCYTYWHTREFEKLYSCLLNLRKIFDDDYPHKEELEFLLIDALVSFEGTKTFYLPISFDTSKNYSDTGKALMAALLFSKEFSSILEKKTTPNPAIYELLCDKYETENYFTIAMYMHSYTGAMWQIADNLEKALIHYEKALKLTAEHKLFVPLLELTLYTYSLIEPIISKLPEQERNIFDNLHRKIHEDTEAFYAQNVNTSIANKNLKEVDLRFISYILANIPNKKIAQNEKISESSVNKKLVSLYEKMHVSGKKELYDLIITSIQKK